MNIFWLIISVLGWGIVHSITATLAVKEWVRRILGDTTLQFYRISYNLFSVISFAPILWLMAVLPDKPLYRIPAPWMYFSVTGQILAIVCLMIGVMQTDLLSFIGLRQLLEEKESSNKLVTHGLYSWVRHPLYTAGLFILWLSPLMSQNTLVVFSCATVYICVGAYFEEQKLIREFGAVYLKYKESTPMLIPGLKKRRN